MPFLYLLGRRYVLLFLLTVTLAITGGRSALGATYPAGFTESWVAGNLLKPTTMAFAPDGRLFILEQEGKVRIVKNGQLLPQPFVTLNVSYTGERGLVGITFDPDFATNGYVYLYYTATTPNIHNRLSRFRAQGDVAAPNSEVALLDIDPLDASIHNGGAMRFGPDGKLYVAIGENSVASNAQTLGNLKGKILRLNKDGSVPTDNPFYNQATGINRAIYALGFRNPYSFDIQPGTGRIFANDVGGSAWEEIDEVKPGRNYGWPTTEGPTNDSRFEAPFYTYPHTGATNGNPDGCAVTGGAFYNPIVGQFPASYNGKYFFTDYCSGWIYTLDTQTRAVTRFASDLEQFPVDLKVGPDGALYYIAHGFGAIYRISYTLQTPPAITAQPQNRTVPVGGSATFTVGVTGSSPLRFQWQRNGTDISGATTASYTVSGATASLNGSLYRVVVTNAFGTATSNAATLTVTSNRAPSATITAPASGFTYIAGQTYTFEGTATDPESGTLPASAFTWRIDAHHDEHNHPFLPDTKGVRSGTFTTPTRTETSSNVWLRIYLTVTDPAGLSTTVTREIFPRKADFILQTNPAGLGLTLDGAPVKTSLTTTGVIGVIREIGAPATQTLGADSYEFVSWSDGGQRVHEINTPATNTTYTANYRRVTTTGLAAPVVQSPQREFSYASLDAARGTASGATSIQGRLQRLSDGFYLVRGANGTVTWQSTPNTLSGTGTTDWSVALGTLPDGRYSFTAIARNSTQTKEAAPVTFWIDNAAPVLAVSTPVGNTTYDSGLANATGTATDNGPGVAQVRGRLFRYSDETWWNGTTWVKEYTETPATGLATWNWKMPALSPGKYTFAAVGSDYRGNVGFSSDVIFFVGGTSPILTVETPRSGFSYNSLATATGKVSDAGEISQVRGTLYRYSNGTWWNGTTWTTTSTEVNATGTSTWSFTLPTLPEGKYAFTATARDNQGRARTSKSVDFWIDATAPTIRVSAPLAGLTYLTLPRASGTASDSGAGVAQVRFYLFRDSDSRWWNGSTWVTTYVEVAAEGLTSWTIPLPTLASGAYRFAAVARDFYGNSRFSPQIPFKIGKGPDRQTFAISSVKITPGAPFTNDTLNATAFATDPGGARVTYKYQWLRTRAGRTTTLSQTGNTLPTAGTVVELGDVVTVTVVANNGLRDSEPVSTSVVIQNSPISIINLSFTPKTPYTFEKMTAGVNTTDADKTRPFYSYTWTKNGVVMQTVTNTRKNQDSYDLNGNDRGSKGDVIEVTVVATDEESTAIKKASATIRNSVPIITQLSLAPQAPTSTQVISPTYVGQDADGDTLTPIYKWSLGTKLLVDERSSRLDLAKYPSVKPGSVITLRMRLSDGSSVSSQKTVSVTVAASASQAAASPAQPAPSRNAS
jgi:glucose/arabinose dehydrogenase